MFHCVRIDKTIGQETEKLWEVYPTEAEARFRFRIWENSNVPNLKHLRVEYLRCDKDPRPAQNYWAKQIEACEITAAKSET